MTDCEELKLKVVEATKVYGLREVQATLVMEGLAPNTAQKLTDSKYHGSLRPLTFKAVQRALSSFKR